MDEKKNMRMVVEEVGKEEVKPAEEVVIEEPQIKEDIKEESSFNILWILIPGMLLLGLLIGGIFAYVFGIQKISDTTKPQNITVEPTEMPTIKPTASPSANLAKYKIKILNGSGIKGEAGKVQTLVEVAGFTVLSTGNAATYDYTKTQITLKTGIDLNFVTALVAALKKNYQLEDTKTVSSQTNDVTVIVGSLKAI